MQVLINNGLHKVITKGHILLKDLHNCLPVGTLKGLCAGFDLNG